MQSQNQNIDSIEKNETTDPNSSNELKHSEWTEENEMIMVEWCDVAQCYKWLNTRAHSRYSYMHAWFTIPAIVLSTISGTASFAQTSLPSQYQVYSPMAIGTLNIFVGILTTIQQYLKISELNEAHRVSAISWDKFARNIRIELAKKPDERMRCEHFLKINRQEFDRLMETSPMVSESIVNEFNKKFKGKPGFDILKKPDICDVITSADVTRYKPLELEFNKTTDEYDKALDEEVHKSKDALISAQNEKIRQKSNELRQKQVEEADRIKYELEKLHQLKKKERSAEENYKEKVKCIEEYVAKYEKMYGRKPLPEDIFDNMKDVANMICLNRFLEEYASNNV